jgi:hypothetical protein
MRDIRQNKTDRPRNLLSIWQCPDCDFYDRQIQVLQAGQKYEVLKGAASIECPLCKSRNFAAVVSEEEVEPFNDNNIIGGKKQGKYRHIRIEGTPYNDEGGCTCGPFKDEWEVKAAATGEKNWEPTLPVQICPTCNKQYHLDWTRTERTYL